MITLVDAATSYEEARKLVELGVDFIGIVVSINDNTPGVLNIKQAREVLLAINGNAKKVVLPFIGVVEDIITIAKATNPDILHIGTNPNIFSPSNTETIKKVCPQIKIIQSIPVIDESSIKIAKKYDGIADFLLLDSKSKKNDQIGGTGETHDWNLSRKIVESVSSPVILAGGLGPDNVAEAILAVKPFGVDSKTKTDKPGSNKKDFKKVRQFVKIVKAIN